MNREIIKYKDGNNNPSIFLAPSGAIASQDNRNNSVPLGGAFICPICNKQFKPNKFNQKYCSVNCQRQRNRKEKDREYYIKKLKRWESFIPKIANCQICKKKIYFNNCKESSAIHFDHRKENISIKIRPTLWLKQNDNTFKNRKIWKSCDFGMLCSRCNRYLPTKNRKNFVEYIKTN